MARARVVLAAASELLMISRVNMSRDSMSDPSFFSLLVSRAASQVDQRRLFILQSFGLSCRVTGRSEARFLRAHALKDTLA
jgi:hypothetical protein